jgi:hypothetical protein
MLGAIFLLLLDPDLKLAASLLFVFSFLRLLYR